MGDERTVTEPLMQAHPGPSQLTRDARWMVVIVLLALVIQHFGATWSTGFTHAGTTYDLQSRPWTWWTVVTVASALVGFAVAVARRGRARFDEHVVMGLALAVVIGVTAFVWLLVPVQVTWLQWAIEHGTAHPFVIGDVTVTSRYADYGS